MKFKPTRILLAVVAVILLTPLSLRSEQPANDGELRVLTYNIHIAIGMDNKLDIPRVAEVIKKINPDLVALQEVDRDADRTQKTDQPKELEELTGMKCVFGRTLGRSNGDYGIAILSKYPVLEQKFTHLPKKPPLEDRGVVEVVVELPSQKKLRFACTHFCHVNDERRAEQAAKLNELLVKDDMPTIIGGDFNAKPKSECIETMLKHWTDATDASPTFPSVKPNTKIDYIFFRPQSELKVKRTEVIDEKLASDHCPVLTVFEWK